MYNKNTYKNSYKNSAKISAKNKGISEYKKKTNKKYKKKTNKKYKKKTNKKYKKKTNKKYKKKTNKKYKKKTNKKYKKKTNKKYKKKTDKKYKKYKKRIRAGFEGVEGYIGGDLHDTSHTNMKSSVLHTGFDSSGRPLPRDDLLWDNFMNEDGSYFTQEQINMLDTDHDGVLDTPEYENLISHYDISSGEETRTLLDANDGDRSVLFHGQNPWHMDDPRRYDITLTERETDLSTSSDEYKEINDVYEDVNNFMPNRGLMEGEITWQQHLDRLQEQCPPGYVCIPEAGVETCADIHGCSDGSPFGSRNMEGSLEASTGQAETEYPDSPLRRFLEHGDWSECDRTPEDSPCNIYRRLFYTPEEDGGYGALERVEQIREDNIQNIYHPATGTETLAGEPRPGDPADPSYGADRPRHGYFGTMLAYGDGGAASDLVVQVQGDDGVSPYIGDLENRMLEAKRNAVATQWHPGGRAFEPINHMHHLALDHLARVQAEVRLQEQYGDDYWDTYFHTHPNSGQPQLAYAEHPEMDVNGDHIISEDEWRQAVVDEFRDAHPDFYSVERFIDNMHQGYRSDVLFGQSMQERAEELAENSVPRDPQQGAHPDSWGRFEICPSLEASGITESGMPCHTDITNMPPDQAAAQKMWMDGKDLEDRSEHVVHCFEDQARLNPADDLAIDGSVTMGHLQVQALCMDSAGQNHGSPTVTSSGEIITPYTPISHLGLEGNPYYGSSPSSET